MPEESQPQPPPTSELDEQLGGIAMRSRRVLTVIIIAQGVMIGVLMIAVGVLSFLQFGERQRVEGDVAAVVQSTCDFFSPLALAGNQLSARTGTKVGVQLVEGSRRAIKGLGCPGALPPPSGTLVELGRKFGVTITY